MRFLLMATLMLWLTSCATKTISTSQNFTTSYHIVLKLNPLRFNDGAFLSKQEDTLSIKPFALGQSLGTIKVSPRFICLKQICTTKATFTSQYLHKSYPADTFERIILGQPIFDGKALKQNNKGFTQHFDDITYRVRHKNIYFKDKQQRLLIKMVVLK